MTSKYFIKLDHFEGPLDLLLHLIKVHEIDVFNIDVFLLTTQYLHYLRLMEFDDLTDAGEFVAMAATLIEIKTRMLLPRQTTVNESGELVEDDPRKPLQDRLVQYELYQQAAKFLEARPQLGVEVMPGNEWRRLEDVFKDVEGPLQGDAASLCILYEQMLKVLADRKPPAKIEAKTHLVSVEETMEKVVKLLETVTFTLFQGLYHTFQARYEFVVHILAVLELVKSGRIRIYQQEPCAPLWIYRSDCDVSILPLSHSLEEALDESKTEALGKEPQIAPLGEPSLLAPPDSTMTMEPGDV